MPGLIDGLRPVVSIRDGARPGEVELRLVAGPLPNAGLAARLCNSLAALGLVCQPALFDGQRLACAEPRDSGDDAVCFCRPRGRPIGC